MDIRPIRIRMVQIARILEGYHCPAGQPLGDVHDGT